MRNSDPEVRIVFVHRHISDPNSVLTVQARGCNFQYVSNFGVPFLPTFWSLHGIVRILQTNDDNTRNDSEDDLLFSRIQSLHHCLEVDFHRHWIIGERMFSWFNISPSSLPNRKSSCG